MLTVKDCLKLGMLSFAEVVAGSRGLSREVKSVTVAEFTEAPSELLRGNELVISALYTIKDDVDKQLAFIEMLNQAKVAGLVLFYLGIYLKELSAEIIKRADELGFPLIVMPKNRIDIAYVDVIVPVMDAIFQEKVQTLQLSIFDKIFRLPSEERKLSTFIRFLSKELGCGLILTDMRLNPIYWNLEEYNIQVDVYEVCSCYRQSIARGSQPTLARKILCDYQIMPVREDTKDIGFLIFVSSQSDNRIPLILQQQAAKATALFTQFIQSMPQDSLTQECALSLLRGNVARALSLTDQGRLYNSINIYKIDIIAIIKVYDLGESYEVPITVDKVRLVERQIEAQNIPGLVTSDKNMIVLLMDTSVLKNREKRLSDFALQIGTCFMKEVGCNIKMGYYGPVDSLYNINAAYERLKVSFIAATLIYPHKQFYVPKDMELPYILLNLASSMGEFVDRYLDPIKQYDQKNGTELLTTFATFLIDCQCSLNEAAQKLYIHPNTLKYRIRTIKKILGYDVLAWPTREELFLALALDRLRQGLKV